MEKQLSIFEAQQAGPCLESISITDGKLAYSPGWIQRSVADQLLATLRKEIEWQQSIISLYGKRIKIPRLNAWYGDENSPYQYSGHYFEPKAWIPTLHSIKEKLESETGHHFNSVLANCYRDGQDSVAWHSDDEPELGVNPVIASISLGEERVFYLRHKYNKRLATRKITLAHGSLLLMSGALQRYWQHQVPKVRKNLGERINLTYRFVIPKS
jgi:alkylated DNA repair dioxygenase AlkB